MPRIRPPAETPVKTLAEAIRARASATTPEEKRAADLACEVAEIRYHAERRARESAAVSPTSASTLETSGAEPRAASEPASASTTRAPTTSPNAVTDPKSSCDATIARESSASNAADLSRRPVTAARGARSGGA